MAAKNVPPISPKHLVWVTWKDAVSLRQEADEAGNTAVNINLGWPGFHTHECYSLVNGVSSTGELDVLNIPVENVIRVEGVLTGRARQHARGGKPLRRARLPKDTR